MNFAISLFNGESSMNLIQAKNIFLTNIIQQKNYSAKTHQTYNYALDNLIKFFEEEYGGLPNVQDIELDDIRPFLGWLQDKGYDRNSIRLKSSAIRSFFKFLYINEYIQTNPTINLSTPKRKKTLPNFLTEKEVEQLLNQFDENINEQLVKKLLIQLIYSTGIRISEALSLKVSDIDANQNTLSVIGKGNKPRIVPFGLLARKLILISITAFKLKEKDYLFQLENGKRISYSQAYHIINSAMKGITETKQKSPHTLRHTFATHLINNGADIRSVGEMLGHSSLSSTQIYTHFSIDKLREIYKNAHPKS